MRIAQTTAIIGAVLMTVGAVPCAAQLSLEPAAVVVFPHILVDGSRETDTVVQLGNASDTPVEVRCSYENLTPACDGDGSCLTDRRECSGSCLVDRGVTVFRVRLTGRQPFGWSVARGRSALPLDGVERVGPDEASNLGTLVPAVGGEFLGVLRCVAVDDRGRPVPRNVLIGSASVETDGAASAARGDAAQYQAVGFRAQFDGDAGDALLSLGVGEEYAPCPDSLMLGHFYDGAALPIADSDDTAWTSLTLVPCRADIDEETATTVQFSTYNEFGQRLSTSRAFDGQFVGELSSLDSSDRQRSIFHVAVVGTLSGQTEINGVGNGLIGVAIEARETLTDAPRRKHAGVRVASEGARPDVAALSILNPPCVADCNGDGAVTINELLTAVGMALNTAAVQACPVVDGDDSGDVLVHELIAAVQAALEGCPPRQIATPTFGVTATPTPRLPTPAQRGPDITLLGIAGGDDGPQGSVGTDTAGRPIYTWPVGQGFTLIAQVRPGNGGQRVALDAAVDGGGALPSFQMIVSRPLGDGSAAVCDADPPNAGGVPAVDPFLFSDAPVVVAAINDLGCRTDDGLAEPRGRASAFCTRLAPTNKTGLVPRFDGGTVQFCVPIARAWAFPEGDTIVAARARDVSGETGPPTEIVIRIPEQP
jgi:hypothetical protein